MFSTEQMYVAVCAYVVVAWTAWTAWTVVVNPKLYRVDKMDHTGAL